MFILAALFMVQLSSQDHIWEQPPPPFSINRCLPNVGRLQGVGSASPSYWQTFQPMRPALLTLYVLIRLFSPDFSASKASLYTVGRCCYFVVQLWVCLYQQGLRAILVVTAFILSHYYLQTSKQDVSVLKCIRGDYFLVKFPLSKITITLTYNFHF